jgi:hypothetical protein
MLLLKDIKARLPRLRERIDELAREIALWKHQETPLLPLEKHQYLEDLHDALAGLDEGLQVLGKRQSGSRRWGFIAWMGRAIEGRGAIAPSAAQDRSGPRLDTGADRIDGCDGGGAGRGVACAGATCDRLQRYRSAPIS